MLLRSQRLPQPAAADAAPAAPDIRHRPPPPPQDAGMGSLLGPGAGGALEERLRASKWDLCMNPRRCASWERLAVEYHVAADDLLVSCCYE